MQIRQTIYIYGWHDIRVIRREAEGEQPMIRLQMLLQALHSDSMCSLNFEFPANGAGLCPRRILSYAMQAGTYDFFQSVDRSVSVRKLVRDSGVHGRMVALSHSLCMPLHEWDGT